MGETLEAQVIALAATLAGLRDLLTGSGLCPELPAAHWQPRNPTAAQDGQSGNQTAAEEQKGGRTSPGAAPPLQAFCDRVADLDLEVGNLQGTAVWLAGEVAGLNGDVAQLMRKVDGLLEDHRSYVYK